MGYTGVSAMTGKWSIASRVTASGF